MSARYVKIRLTALPIKVWLWLNLAVGRIDYVGDKVADWATPKWAGGYRGWLIAAQYFGAASFKDQPPKHRWPSWGLAILTLLIINLALKGVLPRWATIAVTECVVGVVSLGYILRREMYNSQFNPKPIEGQRVTEPKWWIWYLLDPIKHYCHRKLRRNHLALAGFTLVVVGLLGLVATVVLVGGDLPLIQTSRNVRLALIYGSAGFGIAGVVMILTYFYKEAQG